MYTVFSSTACDSACITGGGLMACTASSSSGCCNFYNQSVCVQTCPTNYIYNDITFECHCPDGKTGATCETGGVT